MPANPAACGSALTGLGRARLFLFLSLGSSLANWQQAGTLRRETELYRALLPHLAGVDLVSYGRGEAALAAGLGGLGLRENRMGLPAPLYTRLLASGLTIRGSKPALVKTNQMQGADIALKAARRAGYAFVARCGYLPSNIALWRHGPGSAEVARFQRLEAYVMGQADRVAVTTEGMAEEVCARYGLDLAKVRVVPNFVDTEVFAPPGPQAPPREDDLLLYVGRLHEEKNLVALLEALRGLGLRLMLAGEGPQGPELRRLAQDWGLAVEFLGRVENQDLPGLMARAGAFLLPSKGEHHPKALLEAMSAGMAVMGTAVPGIAELVEPGLSGWLCGLAAPEIRAGLTEMMGDPRQRDLRGQAARRMVLERFSLARVLELELAMLSELVG